MNNRIRIRISIKLLNLLNAAIYRLAGSVAVIMAFVAALRGQTEKCLLLITAGMALKILSFLIQWLYEWQLSQEECHSRQKRDADPKQGNEEPEGISDEDL